ncbi:MAG: hypothetical protein MZU97_04910 [Bacillus subtilis]|nr:hypothetical protein [Bacillus subtilis]
MTGLINNTNLLRAHRPTKSITEGEAVVLEASRANPAFRSSTPCVPATDLNASAPQAGDGASLFTRYFANPLAMRRYDMPKGKLTFRVRTLQGMRPVRHTSVPFKILVSWIRHAMNKSGLQH